MLEKLNQAAEFVRSRTRLQPAVGIILGSGLGNVMQTAEVDAVIPFGEIPNGPRPTGVVGHAGKLLLARAAGVPIAVMQGRIHYYEGYSLDEVIFLPRLLGRLGVTTAIITNAAGGINANFRPGDLMLISDHINTTGVNPLRGPNIDELGHRFPDMTEVYPERLRKLARTAGEETRVGLKEGVYSWLSGPTYETPAETRMLRVLGADATGMSTVPEAVAFAHMSIPVLGISVITNMAPGILPQKVHHGEVLETTARVEKDFARFLMALLPKL